MLVVGATRHDNEKNGMVTRECERMHHPRIATARSGIHTSGDLPQLPIVVQPVPLAVCSHCGGQGRNVCERVAGPWTGLPARGGLQQHCTVHAMLRRRVFYTCKFVIAVSIGGYRQWIFRNLDTYLEAEHLGVGSRIRNEAVHGDCGVAQAMRCRRRVRGSGCDAWRQRRALCDTQHGGSVQHGGSLASSVTSKRAWKSRCAHN